jgi:hypothetical protein
VRRRLAKIAISAILVAGLVPVVSEPALAGPSEADLAAGVARQLAQGIQIVPKGSAASGKAAAAPGGDATAAAANPFTSLLPDPTVVDKFYWEQVANQKSAARAAQLAQKQEAASAKAARLRQAAPPPPFIHDENEPAGIFGANDSHATAELVTGFGTGRRENNRARVLGQFSPEVATIINLSPFAEDDGSIPLAGDPLITSFRRGMRILNSAIGNGPHGSTGDDTGDFDFIEITVIAGQQLIVDTDTPTGPLDTVVALYNSAGTVLASNDDSGGTLDSFLQFTFTTPGTYFVMVSGFGIGTIFPDDPFDSGSGNGTGSEGPYDITLTVATPDRDFYAVDLDAGDVLGASVVGAGTRLVVRDPGGREVMGSDQDASFIYSPNAPLPGGGNAVVDHVAARAGRYSLEVVGTAGTYDVTLEAYRPGPEATRRGTVQTLFLDFNGQRVNTAIWGGPGVRDLSPLAGFLGRWGLTAADQNALINAIIAGVRENIITDITARGTNPRFGLRILNSRDHADPFGQPNVHRIIVGGTIAESGISTIGIAQFIDPGNYSTDDSAVVLLDVLSNPTGAASLNTYITPASDKIAFIGRAIANVVTHEGGHLYGNFHTDTFNTTPNLMDAGGNVPGLFGVGPDNIGGTADDVDYDFGEDVLFPNEGFTGIEDTLNTTAWALVKGTK